MLSCPCVSRSSTGRRPRMRTPRTRRRWQYVPLPLGCSADTFFTVVLHSEMGPSTFFTVDPIEAVEPEAAASAHLAMIGSPGVLPAGAKILSTQPPHETAITTRRPLSIVRGSMPATSSPTPPARRNRPRSNTVMRALRRRVHGCKHPCLTFTVDVHGSRFRLSPSRGLKTTESLPHARRPYPWAYSSKGLHRGC